MKPLLTACASLLFALGAGCGGDHTGLPSSPPFDPIGTEPTSGGDGAGASGSIYELFCDRSCVNTDRACGTSYAKYCTPACVANMVNYHGCEAEELTYLACMGTTHITCTFGYPRAPDCDPALLAINNCRITIPPGPF